MSMDTLQHVADATSGALRGADRGFLAVNTDTRTLQQNELFFALRGEHFDAGEFVALAADRGAAGAVVEQFAALDVPQIQVTDTRVALADYARAWRSQLGLPVIGITGSNGKTTVKELLAAIMRCAFDDKSADNYVASSSAVLATIGNLNNDIGVPLTLLRLRPEHRLAVVEMGASQHGDIDLLAAIATPNIAIITNIARAHLEGLGSLDGVALTKGAILDRLGAGGTAVLNQDSPYFPALAARAGAAHVVSFGSSAAADVRAAGVQSRDVNGALGFEFELHTPQGAVPVVLPLAGAHNVVNAAAAAAAALAAGADLQHVQSGLQQATNVGGRLRSVSLACGATLYDDSYNANPDSMAAAIAEMQRLGGHVVLVLGDMGELGADADQLHAAIGELGHTSGAAALLCTGELSRAMAVAFGPQARWCASLDELEAAVREVLRPDTKLLIKASRFMGLDQLVSALQVDAESAASVAGER